MLLTLLNTYPAEFIDFLRCPRLDNRRLNIPHDNIIGEVPGYHIDVDLMANTDDARITYASWSPDMESATDHLLLRSDPDTGETVAFLNSDVLADLELLRQLMQVKESDKQLIAVHADTDIPQQDIDRVRKIARECKTGIVFFEWSDTPSRSAR